jgi:hypothetical protein
MKVWCLVLRELLEEVPCSTPGCPGPAYLPVWVCSIDQARSCEVDNVFHYEVTDDEDAEFGGVAEGKLVELTIEEIHTGSDGFVRMAGTVSKFGWEPRRD